MAQAVSISLAKFTKSVQAAIKAAAEKHPKFKGNPPNAITISYLIRGYPPVESVVANASLGELQAYADEVARQIAGAHPEAFAAAGQASGQEGAILSIGRHVLIGIPPIAQTIRLEE